MRNSNEQTERPWREVNTSPLMNSGPIGLRAGGFLRGSKMKIESIIKLYEYKIEATKSTIKFYENSPNPDVKNHIAWLNQTLFVYEEVLFYLKDGNSGKDVDPKKLSNLPNIKYEPIDETDKDDNDETKILENEIKNKILENRVLEKKYGGLYRYLYQDGPLIDTENNNQPNMDENSISIKVYKGKIRVDSLPVGQSFVYSPPGDKTLSYVYEAKIEQFLETSESLLVKIKGPFHKDGQWYSINKFNELFKIIALINPSE